MKPPWSEVIVFWDVSSGIAPPARRRALAGEGSCASDHSSGERMFAGGHRFPGGRTPAKPPWSEVMIFLDVLLRQSTPLQEKSPYRRRELCQRSQFRRANVRRRTSISRRPKSGEAAVVGGDDLFGCSPPAEQPLTGGNPYRRRGLYQLPQFRRANVRRRTSISQRPKSGEAAVVGGNHFCGSPPPAEHPLTGGNPYRRRGLCQLPQFRRANVRRRTLISRQSNFGEAAVVGSDDLFGGCPPARKPLTGGEPLSEKRVMPMTPGPVSECSPEEVALRAAVVRRSRCGRR